MKEIRKIVYFVMILILTFCVKVNANTINNIDIDVYIDQNGNAKIKEIWKVYLDTGTEGYKTISKNGNYSISNFIVTDDSGRIYKNIGSWDTRYNFQEKSYKNGVLNKQNEIELCWGISNYGNRVYTLEYDVYNLVEQYYDTQGIYFNFLNIDQNVENAKVSIYTDFSLSLNNSQIWSFGNKGTINFENGKVVMKSNGRLNSSQYMVALIRFNENIYQTQNRINKTFDNIYDEAFQEAKTNPFLNIITTISDFIKAMNEKGILGKIVN